MNIMSYISFIFLFNIVLICCTTIKSENLPQSKLCFPHDVSCNSQLLQNAGLMQNIDDDTCKVTYYKRNSSECHNLPIQGDANMLFPGNITLKSYLYVQDRVYRQSAFNVSFDDISWQSLRMRFEQNGLVKDHNFCRDFTLRPVALQTKASLFYDCLWSRANYEKTTYHLQIAAQKEDKTAYRKFTFIVPEAKSRDSTTNIKDWEVFMYVDVSIPNKLILHFEPMPRNFKVDQYIVNMSGSNSENTKEIEIIHDEEEGTELQLEFETPIKGYPYTFTVLPMHADCGEKGCKLSKSPNILYAETSDSLIGLYVAIAICILFVGLLIMCLNRLIKRISVSQAELVKPKVLFIYKATHQSHVNVIDKLAAFLEDAHITVLLDRRDIQKSDIKDPYNWYLNAYDEADVVLVFSSLQCCPSDTVGIHRRVDNIALVQLKGAVANKKHRFAKVLLPYCKKTDIPKEASKFKLIQLPGGMDNLIHFIKDEDCMSKFINMPCLDNNLDIKSSEFQTALNDAVEILSKHTVTENSNCNNIEEYNQEDNYLDLKDTDEMLLGKKIDDDELETPEIDHEEIYPKFGELNLIGDDCNSLIPQNSQSNGNEEYNPLGNLNL